MRLHGEITGLAKALGIDPGMVLLLQLAYETSVSCTSLVPIVPLAFALDATLLPCPKQREAIRLPHPLTFANQVVDVDPKVARCKQDRKWHNMVRASIDYSEYKQAPPEGGYPPVHARTLDWDAPFLREMTIEVLRVHVALSFKCHESRRVMQNTELC